MSGPPLVGGGFAEHLAANREAINQAVLATARQSTAFDAAAFTGILREVVAPIADAVERQGDGFVGVVSQALIEIALDLSAQSRFEGAVRDGWQQLLPVLAGPLSVDPRRVIASVTNALDTLGRAPGARPDRWLERMAAVAELAAGPDDLLAAGQVAAWCSGMAAYRSQALAVAAALPAPVAAAALGLAPAEDPAPVLERLRTDPWFDPVAPVPAAGAAERPPVAVGSFRGFGGAFLRPPTIAVAATGVAEPVVVTDGEERFAVFADAFGWAILRAALPAGATDPGPPNGTVEAVPDELAGIPEITGWAPVASGLVATSALSHAVLFTRPRPGP